MVLLYEFTEHFLVEDRDPAFNGVWITAKAIDLHQRIK